MVEFSTTTRLVAALVFVLISAAFWQWLQRSSSKLPVATTLDKKKSKKKTKKKKKAEPAQTHEEDAQPSTQDHSASVFSALANDSDDDSNDEDAGLTAKQILAKRRFKPKAIGGHIAPASTPTLVRFQAEQRVVARFQDGRDWFPGIVLEVRRGNEYHIKYDDGEIEYHVPHARIKDAAVAASESDKRAPVKRATAGIRSNLDPRLTADANRSEADDEADSAGNDDVDSSSDDGDDAGQESEDGWQVVGAAEAAAKKRRLAAAVAAVGADPVDAEGLTKRQREARRKKERKKELKEMVRAQNQEHGLHARWGGTMTRLKYVPPPTASSSSS